MITEYNQEVAAQYRDAGIAASGSCVNRVDIKSITPLVRYWYEQAGLNHELKSFPEVILCASPREAVQLIERSKHRGKNVGNIMRKTFQHKVYEWLNHGYETQVDKDVRETINNQFGDNRPDFMVAEALGMSPQLRDSVLRLQEDSRWISWAEFVLKELKIRIQNRREYGFYKKLVESADWMICFERTCYVTDRPIGRNYKAGPALKYCDDFRVYAIDGQVCPREYVEDPTAITELQYDLETRWDFKAHILKFHPEFVTLKRYKEIPKWGNYDELKKFMLSQHPEYIDVDLFDEESLETKKYILEQHPEYITAERIDAENNLEVKRIMLDKFGTEKWIKLGGAKKIHEAPDPTQPHQFLALYEKPWARVQTSFKHFEEPVLKIVRAVNGTPEPDGTFKEYYIPVPSNMTDAVEAIAWTYNMSKEEYINLAGQRS